MDRYSPRGTCVAPLKRAEVPCAIRRASNRRGKENECQQTRNVKNEKSQDKRRMMMELTDLRAESRELRELTRKQKVDNAIGERVAQNLKDENRTLKDQLTILHHQATSKSPRHYAERSSFRGWPVGVPEPEEKHSRASTPMTATTPVTATSTFTNIASTQTAGDGDASGGGERRGPLLSSRAVAAGNAAGNAIANVLAKQGLEVSRHDAPTLSLKPTGCSREAGEESQSSAPCAALQQLAEGSISPKSRERYVRIIEEHVAALRQEIEELKVTDNENPQANVRKKTMRGHSEAQQILDEPVGAVLTARHLEHESLQQATSKIEECCLRLATQTDETRCQGLALDSETSSLKVTPRLPISIEVPSAGANFTSAPSRPTAEGTQTRGAARFSAGSRGVSPRGRFGSFSPRLDESCNSARDSVHSLMTRDAVHTKLDKMNDHIHGMLLAGTATVAETAVLLAKNWVMGGTPATTEAVSPEISPPVSPTSLLTASTSIGETNSMPKCQHGSALDSFDRVSRFLAQHTQEADDVQVLHQRLSGQELENRALRNRLQQVECIQRTCQREMRALRQIALKSNRSSEASSRQSRSSFGGGTTPVEDADRWCQLSSAPSDTSPSLVVQAATRSAVPKAAYCWPPPAASHRPSWQRSIEEQPLGGRGRTAAIHRSLSMVGPPSMHCRRLAQRSASMSVLPPCSGSHTPSGHTTGSTTRTMEGATAQILTSGSMPTLLRSASLPMTRARSSSPLPSFIVPPTSCLNAQSAPVSRSPSPRASLAVTPGLARSRSPSPGGTPKVTHRQIEPKVLVKIRDSPPRRVLPEGSLIHRSHWRLVNKNGALSDAC